MTAATLGEMKTLLLTRTNKSSTSTRNGVTNDTLAEESLLSAIRYYEGKTFYFLEDNAELTLSGSAATTALPTDFSHPIDARIQDASGTWLGEDDGFLPATRRKVKNRRKDDSEGQPWRWCVFNGNLEFDRVADQAYLVDLDYYHKDATLPGADSLSSVYFDEAQDMILEQAQGYFYDIYEDSNMAQVHRQKASELENNFVTRGNRRTPPGAQRG